VDYAVRSVRMYGWVGLDGFAALFDFGPQTSNVGEIVVTYPRLVSLL